MTVTSPPGRLGRRARSWLMDASILLGVLAGAHLYTTRNSVRGAAPALVGVSVDGQPVSLAQLHGEPVLVQFWATWCPVCHQEEGALQALAGAHRVLTVAEDSGPSASVGAYLSSRGLHYPALADATGDIGRAWRVDRFPTSFVIDGEGRIRFIEVGYTSGLGLRLRLWLAGL